MSLIVAVKGPEGIALAADSRDTLADTVPLGTTTTKLFSHFDNATKLFSLQGQPHIGIGISGAASLGGDPRPLTEYLPELEEYLDGFYRGKRPTVKKIARKVRDFYDEQRIGQVNPQTPHFLVAGFNESDLFGRIYEVAVPSLGSDPQSPVSRFRGKNFGVATLGRDEMAWRILYGFDYRAMGVIRDWCPESIKQQVDELYQRLYEQMLLPIRFDHLSLQDCVDISRFLVRVTSDAQRWALEVRDVGGPVDVAVITRTEGFKFITKKQIM